MLKQEMQSIPIDDLFLREELTVDIYLALGADKFILVAKSGAPSSGLAKYKLKNVDRVFVKITDYFHWIHRVIGEAEIAHKDGASPLARISHLQTALSSVYQEISDFGMNDTVFNHVKMVNHLTLSYLSKSNQLIDMLASLQMVEDTNIKNAMMVSMISSMLGVAQDWTKPGTIEKLSLAGFLHDVGKTKLPKSISGTPFSRLGTDDRIIFKSHAETGSLMLVQIKTVPDDIRIAVWEHHENADGTGYPRGIKDLQMSPFGRIVALADAYTEELESITAKTATERSELAFKNIMAKKELFNRDVLKAFQKVFQSTLLKAAG
jgi:HD-GYP domain-containing protein (c-di-GMP phosphodiesterase class II)